MAAFMKIEYHNNVNNSNNNNNNIIATRRRRRRIKEHKERRKQSLVKTFNLIEMSISSWTRKVCSHFCGYSCQPSHISSFSFSASPLPVCLSPLGQQFSFFFWLLVFSYFWLERFISNASIALFIPLYFCLFMSLLVCLIFSNGFLSLILHFLAVFLSLFKSFFTSCSQCGSFVLLSISMDYRGI